MEHPHVRDRRGARTESGTLRLPRKDVHPDMSALLRRLRQDGSAQAMVEYGLIIGLVALVVAGAVFALSGGLKSIFGNVNTCLNSASTSTLSCSTTTSTGS